MTKPITKVLLTALVTIASAAAQTITIAGPTEPVNLGSTFQFKATLTKITGSVVWSVNGAPTTGAINATTGLYKTPASVPTPNTVTVTATAGSVSAKSTFLVRQVPAIISSWNPYSLPAGPFTLTVSGHNFTPTATVQLGTIPVQTKYISQYYLTVTGTIPTGASGQVPISVTLPGVGGGTYTSPYKVPIGSGGGGGTPSISVSPSTATVVIGKQQTFTATQTNLTGTVTWSASAGTITSAGVFTAPATVPNPATVTITASDSGTTGTATVTIVAAPKPSISVSPTTVSLTAGSQQTFTATQTNLTGTVTWSASAGTITSAGVYTAPATVPNPATVTITASDAGTTGTATATITAPALKPAISSLTPAALPFGPYSLTVIGSNFTSGAAITIGGVTLPTTFVSATQLTAVGVTLASQQGSTVALTVTNGAPGNAVSAAVNVPVGVQNPKVSTTAASRFLEQAAFGPRPSDVMAVQQLGFQAWLAQQFAATPGTLYSGSGEGGFVNSMQTRFMTNAAMGTNNQLRQRVAFALSQFFVVSFNKLFWTTQMAPYQEMLYSNAFTTYPNLLQKVTLDPAMGVFLDMVNNDKADPTLGSVANENYAREIMQLFSIGVIQLNADGTPVLVGGATAPTYNQTTVQNFAKVFTGWTFAPVAGQTMQPHNNTNMLAPMVAYEPLHDTTSKTLLNGLALPAGQTAEQDMAAAIANVVAHPNVAPFVSKFLIQHLVTSNPSPAYVQRVATVFNNNGQGVKGDMQAVITAILLDQEARAGDTTPTDPSAYGHLQEPALYISNVIRSMNGTVDDTNYFPWDMLQMGQDLFNPASVFNYYSPQYQVGSVLAPEFQIQSPWVAVARVNFIDGLFGSYSGTQATYGPGTTIDLTPWMALAGNPAALVDALDSTFTHGQMPAQMKSDIVTAVAAVIDGNLRRVQVGTFLIVSSSFYQVMH